MITLNNQENDYKILENIKKNIFYFNSKTVLKGGINSKVILLESSNKRYVLKIYSNEFQKQNNRLLNELNFLNALLENGEEYVPKPICNNLNSNWAMFSYIDGNSISELNKDIIIAVINFFERLHYIKEKNSKLSINKAAEACFSIHQHLRIIKYRLKAIQYPINESPINIKASNWINKCLYPKFREIEIQVSDKYGLKESMSKISKKEIILSPSDVGIHNMINRDNTYYFLDFEYSGFDDVGKYLVDWILRPGQKIKTDYINLLINGIEKILKSNDFKMRLNYLLELYKIKWTIIMLNKFRKSGQNENDLKDILHRAQIYYENVKDKIYFEY